MIRRASSDSAIVSQSALIGTRTAALFGALWHSRTSCDDERINRHCQRRPSPSVTVRDSTAGAYAGGSHWRSHLQGDAPLGFVHLLREDIVARTACLRPRDFPIPRLLPVSGDDLELVPKVPTAWALSHLLKDPHPIPPARRRSRTTKYLFLLPPVVVMSEPVS